MTENNKLQHEMTVDEALQYADERTMGATFYEGKRDLQVVFWLLAYEVRRLRKLEATADSQGKKVQGQDESKPSY
jgi:hypothetical protein